MAAISPVWDRRRQGLTTHRQAYVAPKGRQALMFLVEQRWKWLKIAKQVV